MKRKAIALVLLLLSSMASTSFGEISVIHMNGTGARALGLGNNFVALSNDQSALFWNPAGLAFVPVREFQIGIDGLSQRSQSDFYGQTNSTVVQRIRLTNLGYLHSFPSTQGGFTIAGALQNPYIFDDARKFSGSYISSDNQNVGVSRSDKDYGSLNYWTGGFGLQVAEGLAVGISAAFVTGNETDHNVFLEDTNGVVNNTGFNNDYDQNLTRSYMGYDLRLGLLYNFAKNFNIGLRFVLPQTVWFTEDATESYPHTPGEPDYTYPQRNGKIFSSYSGALGVSGAFSFLTLATEFRARAPYSLAYPAEMIPDQSLAGKTLVGAGLGLEVPLAKGNTLLRAGYSWDQYDTHPFARKYDDMPDVNWDPHGEIPVGDRQSLTGGVAFIMKNACLEISYGYSFWKLRTQDVLTETYSQNRLLTSLSFRF
jgi:hypothetical protein